MKSADSSTALLPSGKEWVKLDMSQATGQGRASTQGAAGADAGGRACSSSQRTTTPVKTIGTETIDGVETTHYRAAIDTRKVPAAASFQKLTKAGFKPIDVWVDGDGLVRQVESRLHDQLVDPTDGAAGTGDC